jgi:hypothetical protein
MYIDSTNKSINFCCNLFWDYGSIDSMLQIKTKINDMHTQEVVFQNCKYKQTDRVAGGYKMRINPLF